MDADVQSTSGPGAIPDAVWVCILRRLKFHHLASFRGCCRRFRALANETVRKIRVDPTKAEDALSWQLHQRFPQLEHFEVMKPSEVDCFTDQTFAQLALKDLSRCSSLTSCNLENCTQLTVAGMSALTLACPVIKRLVIPQVCQLCMSDSMLLVLSRLPELSKLRVQCCKHCDEVALAYLSDLRHLTALELEDYGQALRQVTQLTCLTNLRSVMVWSDFQIDVSEHGLGLAMGLGAGHGHGQLPLHGAHAHPMPLPAHGLVPVGPGVAVAAVDQNGQPFNPIMAAAAAAAAAVAHLQLNANGGGAGGGPEAGPGGGGGEGGGWEPHAAAGLAGAGGGVGGEGGMGAGGAGLAGLLHHPDVAFAHQLELTEQVLNNIFAGKTALLSWVTGMTALTHVDIQRVDINSGELEQFAALPGLVHLGVGDLTMLLEPSRTLPSVTKLVSHNILNEQYLRTTFPALRALSCDAADSGLAHIAELTGLVNLFLWTSPSDAITDTGLGCLGSLRRLETFRLEGSDTLSDAGWVRFAEAHTALTRIDLVKCPGLTDIGLILSIRQLSRLERISFVDCPGIDTRTLAALMACCPGLEYIELQDCAAMTLASLRTLLATVNRPDLEVVYKKGGTARTLHGGNGS